MNLRNRPSCSSFNRRFFAFSSPLLSVVATTGLAATITVNNNADSSTGSLRSALASAANGDAIVFSLTLPTTITLTSGQLNVSTNVGILGPGAASLAVNAGGSNRVFHVAPLTTVTIAGLTITNGNIAGGYPADGGGGIHNDHATLIGGGGHTPQ